jgi:uncharacterized coiled-coil DUF342 family protein
MDMLAPPKGKSGTQSLRDAVSAIVNDPRAREIKRQVQEINEMSWALQDAKFTAEQARKLPQMLADVKRQLEEMQEMSVMAQQVKELQ